MIISLGIIVYSKSFITGSRGVETIEVLELYTTYLSIIYNTKDYFLNIDIMSEPILENAEPKVEKKKRKPLSEEDKKRQLENLRLGRERAHQKRRELEAMGREMAKKETLDRKSVV